jgi:hypothetical protein
MCGVCHFPRAGRDEPENRFGPAKRDRTSAPGAPFLSSGELTLRDRHPAWDLRAVPPICTMVFLWCAAAVGVQNRLFGAQVSGS